MSIKSLQGRQCLSATFITGPQIHPPSCTPSPPPYPATGSGERCPGWLQAHFWHICIS